MTYEVYRSYRKKRDKVRVFNSIVRARAYAVADSMTKSEDFVEDHPMYIKEGGADDREWVGKVEYYPDEGFVWCVRGRHFDYYPLHSDGTLGKKHSF